MKQLLLLIVCILMISTVMSQSELISRKKACQFEGNEPTRFDEAETIYGFASTPEAEEVVNRILAIVYSNMKKARFIIRAADVPNAEASVEGEKRVILYNVDFMLRAGNQGDWVSTFILAHEIGHHFLGHTLSAEGSRPNEELDADEWAGSIMCGLGANLDEAQLAIKTMIKDGPARPGSTHPPKSARIQAVSVGFALAHCKAGGNPEVTKPDAPRPGLDPNYVNFKAEGDNAYKEGKWAVAKMNYQDALGYKPGDSYCTSQIKECEKQLSLQKQKDEEEEKKRQAQEQENNYQRSRKNGDNYYNNNQWTDAKAAYRDALTYKSGDSYCASRISECNEKIASAEEEKKKKSNTKPTDQPDFVSMVYVQGGTFTMGCTSEQGSDCFDDERPSHSVTLGNYWIGKYEVTQAEWREIMGSNPSNFSGCDNCPVEQVSWEDIQDFLRTLNQKYPGRNYRLPTEAEWEYAARGGNKKDGTKYAGSSSLDNVAWHSGNSGSKTHPVGEKAANGLGLYDMSGNVREWCSDWYGSYSSSSQTNPTGASSGSSRVNRGGSWLSGARYSRTSRRSSNSPTNRYGYIGFRLSRTE